MAAMDLRLRPTGLQTASGMPAKDDWIVVLDRQHTIGRIMRTRIAGNAWIWCWYLHLFPNSPADRGNADTLDEAKAAFRRRVEEAWPFDPVTMRR